MSAALIRQRRTQMVIHSYLYYVHDTPIVSDDTWQRWADDLVVLQREFTGNLKFYDREFADWTGDTGMHLPKDQWVREKAAQLLKLNATLGKLPPAPAAPPAPPRPAAVQASLF